MIVVTGGAGFIGSVLLWELNRRGETNILIVDELDHDEKERNIGSLQYEELVSIPDFREGMLHGDYNDAGIEAIFHLGACSDTTEEDWDYLSDNNVEYSKDIIRWATDHGVRCIYASSAATYGNGDLGYSDDHDLFDQLQPLNLYGKSKLEVDIWARDGGYLDQAVGVRYFNVFGPNEAHKEHMRSVIAKQFDKVQSEGVIKLFKSNHPDFEDGEQMRDFIYVKDAVAATLFFHDNPEVAGVFNVGTGEARTWNDVARSIFTALGKEPKIEYIDMPEELAGQYQNYTQADIEKLEAVGYTGPWTPLEEAISDYVTKYLLPDIHLGEK